jgi:diguanylate cyclase (GGDEF)-like protein
MTTFLSRTLERFQTLRAEHDSVAETALQDSLRRLPWTFAALIPLLLLGALVNWNQPNAMAPAAYAGKNIASWLNIALAVSLLVTALVFRLNRLSHRRSAFLLVLLALIYLLVLGVRSAIDQWGSSSVTMFSLGCVFVGTLLLIRPIHATLVYLAGYAVFHYVLGLTQPNPGLLQINRVQGLSAAVLGLLLSMLLWRKHTVMILLQRELEAQRKAVELSNEELKKQQLELQVLSQRDTLTGLFNRREFAKLADMALLRARRDNSSTAAIMADLDFFKRVNDTYGHPAGDEVIKFMANSLRSCVRGTDIIARMGGEEFIVLLPGTTLDEAAAVAEKIRDLVQRTPIPISAEPDIQVTASFGVTGFDVNQATSLDALYAAVDLALYAAKKGGRNRVEARVAAV